MSDLINRSALLERFKKLKGADTLANMFISDVIKEIKRLPAEHNNGWIPCSERLPENEQEVEITYIRKHYRIDEVLYYTARAFYEDGALVTEDSDYNWNETDNWQRDEDRECAIIPEGWYESVSFTEEFGIVDMPVIAWRPLPEPYREEIKDD